MTQVAERKQYTPKMVQMTNFGAATVQDVKKNFPMSYSVWNQGDKVVVFHSAPRTVERLKEKYPQATIETVPSDNAVFLAALKGQSQLNFNIFKALNPDLKTVGVSIRSAPQEAFQTETAIAYAKTILGGLKNAKDTAFNVRAWLFDEFVGLQKANNDSFAVRKQRNPIRTNKDKAIVTRAIIPIEDAAQLLKALETVQRTPVCVFFDPEAPRAPRKPRVVNGEKKERKPRAPKPAGEKRERKPRADKPASDKPKVERAPRAEKAPRAPRVPRAEGAERTVATFMMKLEDFPAKTNEMLLPTLIQKKESGELKALDIRIAQQINIMIRTEKANVEATQLLLDRIKINSKQVPYDVRQ